MSTAETTTVEAPAAPQYDNPTAPGYVAPPEGYRYRKSRETGKVIILADGKPETVKKKQGKRNKAKKPTYTVPEGRLRSHETPGFNYETMAKLKPTDFADPLDHAMWEKGYYEQKVTMANKDIERIRSLGATPEERNEAKEELRMLKAMENLLAKKSGNAAAKSRLVERLGALFAEASSS